MFNIEFMGLIYDIVGVFRSIPKTIPVMPQEYHIDNFRHISADIVKETLR